MTKKTKQPKCPNCDITITKLSYSAKVLTGGTYNQDGTIEEDSISPDILEDTYYCPECGHKICEGEKNASDFLNGKLQKEKTYTCPHCKEKQTYVLEWQATEIGYPKDIDGNFLDAIDKEFADSSDFTGYTCPTCKTELPTKLIDKLGL